MSDDLVDGDIVHYAIMGLHEHGRKRVSVITADDPGTVAHRLAYAKWLYLSAVFSAEAADGPRRNQLWEGLVHRRRKRAAH